MKPVRLVATCLVLATLSSCSFIKPVVTPVFKRVFQRHPRTSEVTPPNAATDAAGQQTADGQKPADGTAPGTTDGAPTTPSTSTPAAPAANVVSAATNAAATATNAVTTAATAVEPANYVPTAAQQQAAIALLRQQQQQQQQAQPQKQPVQQVQNPRQQVNNNPITTVNLPPVDTTPTVSSGVPGGRAIRMGLTPEEASSSKDAVAPKPNTPERHGFRSPSLPKGLPMDVNGKLTPESNR